MHLICLNSYKITSNFKNIYRKYDGNDNKSNLNTPVSNKSNKYERNVAGYDDPNLINNNYKSSSNMGSNEKNNSNNNNNFYNKSNYSNYSNNNQNQNSNSPPKIELNHYMSSPKIQNADNQSNNTMIG